MKSYGIQGQLLEWFKGYLFDRRQCVLVNNSFSEYKNIKAGVPQGSVLGPLLFLIYVNYIADNLKSLTRLFADDTSLSNSAFTKQLLEQVINRDLVKMEHWSKQWLVKFNSNKTQFLFISNLQDTEGLELFLQNDILEPCDKHKHLGVTFRDAWNIHGLGNNIEDIFFKMKLNCDINILMETWKGGDKNFNIEGFNSLCKIRKKNKKAKKDTVAVL